MSRPPTYQESACEFLHNVLSRNVQDTENTIEVSIRFRECCMISLKRPYKKLCDRCRLIRFDHTVVRRIVLKDLENPREVDRWSYQHAEHLWQVAFGAEHGCPLCNMLLDMWTTESPGWSYRKYRELDSLGVELRADSGGAPKITAHGDLSCDFDITPLNGRFASISDSVAEDSTTGSAISIELAKLWLQDCTDSHCTRDCLPVVKRLLPTRIIDVGGIGDVKLVQSDNLVRAHYAVLSHCWGEVPFLNTQTSNIAEHVKQIPWNSLPKTFQDTISVVRQLGIRYLWIDSICIIQDSREDWDAESAKMSSIYQDAYLHISAAHTPSPCDGLFAERDGWAKRPSKLRFKNGAGESVYAQHGDTRQPRGPLDSRAWVYQEQILAQRSLIFASDGLYWFCHTVVASEKDPEGRTKHDELFKKHRSHKYSKRATLDIETIPSPSTIMTLRGDSAGPSSWHPTDPLSPIRTRRGSQFDTHIAHGEWYADVCQYAQRALTVSTDRLPGISGLAAIMHAHIPEDEYIAGIWQNDMHRGLLWSTHDTDNRAMPRATHPPLFYVAPSWSWASRGGWNISYHWTLNQLEGREWRQLFTSLRTDVQLRGQNPYGEVSRASLDIEGQVAEVNVFNMLNDPHFEYKHGIYFQMDDANRSDTFAASKAIWLLAVIALSIRGTEEYLCLVIRQTRLWTSENNEFQRIGVAKVKDRYMQLRGQIRQIRLE